MRQGLGSVGAEPGAGLLPFALGAPLVTLFQAVNFATFLAVPGTSIRRLAAIAAVVRAARWRAYHD